jgi:hypothetical protein
MLTLILIGYILVAALLLLRYGYLAATESTGSRKGRATLIATLVFASFFLVLPLLSTIHESQLQVFDFNGVIASIRVLDSSTKYYSAQLSILTSQGGNITVHVSDRSYAWRVGQRLRVRYFGDTGELIRATVIDSSGKEEGIVNRTAGFSRIWFVLIGLFFVGGAWVRFRRDPSGAIENAKESETLTQVHLFNADDLQSQGKKK